MKYFMLEQNLKKEKDMSSADRVGEILQVGKGRP